MTAPEVIEALRSRGMTLATCESITAGLICGALTEVPGSSHVVRGGLITYATDMKTTLAGVDPGLIEKEGVVSAGVARAMAQGAREVCDADWGIGVSGVAGPGSSGGVPAGTAWLGVVGPRSEAVILLEESGSRAEVRRLVVGRAIDLIKELVSQDLP